jgi:hypothetical protein
LASAAREFEEAALSEASTPNRPAFQLLVERVDVSQTVSTSGRAGDDTGGVDATVFGGVKEQRATFLN